MRRADTRLLTLTGAGGIGKTRLALQIARAYAQDYSGGAWFVAFAEIADPGLICRRSARHSSFPTSDRSGRP